MTNATTTWQVVNDETGSIYAYGLTREQADEINAFQAGPAYSVRATPAGWAAPVKAAPVAVDPFAEFEVRS